MLTTAGIVEDIVITTIMVRKRVTGKVITTDVTIGIIITVRKKILVFTGVYIVTYLIIATDHIGTDAMVAGDKKTKL